MNDCTIDEWVLRVIREGGDDYHVCLLFIETFLSKKRCQICVDTGGVITRLYNRIANRNTGLSDPVKQWWFAIQADLKMRPVEPRITEAMRRILKKMDFHDDDYIWVGVAYASNDKGIVSGDSDFGCNLNSPDKNKEEVREYLEENGIHAIHPREALQLLQKTQT